MFTKEERLFIWKKVYEMIDRLEDGEFNAKDANFLWRQIGRIDGVIETLNRTEGEMPEIIAGMLKRIRDDIDKFVDNKTKDYENI